MSQKKEHEDIIDIDEESSKKKKLHSRNENLDEEEIISIPSKKIKITSSSSKNKSINTKTFENGADETKTNLIPKSDSIKTKNIISNSSTKDTPIKNQFMVESKSKIHPKEESGKKNVQIEAQSKLTSEVNTNSNPSYFLYLMPDESGENYENDMVKYNIHLVKLPGTILDWFEALWKHAAPHEYIKSTLNVECPLGLWTVFDPEYDEMPPKQKFANQHDLFEFLKKNIADERGIVANEHALLVSTTSEFDWEYAFFELDAVKKQVLGKYLQPLVKVNTLGEVEKEKETIIMSAYL